MTKFPTNKTIQDTIASPINRPPLMGTYQGIIMENRDAQTMGRLSVWIPDLGGDQKKQSSWFTVSYASPFAGATSIDNLSDDGTDAQRSYGFWMVPPDIGNEVLICFVNGDAARGFFFACLYQQNMNQMVPGQAADKTGLPVVEYSRKDKNIDVNDPVRKKFDARVNGLTEQGLLDDPIRGPGTSSARREAPSRVFGYSTPRGNSIYADDGEIDSTKTRDIKVDSDSDDLKPKNEMIRMRTRSGMQIMLNESEGYIYMVSKNGKAWIQLGDDGIDFYSEKGFSIRTSGTQDIQTDGPLNIDATGDLNIIAGGKLNIYGVGNTSIGSDGDLIMEAKGKASIKAASDIASSSGGDYLVETGGTLGLKAGGNNMRSGTILDNSGSVPGANAASAIKPKRQSSPDVINKSEASRDTALSRMPTAEPFKGHTNKGGATAGVSPTTSNTKDGVAPPVAKNNAPLSPKKLERAAAIEACVSQAVKDIQAKHPDAGFVTYGYLMATADFESKGFNPNAVSPTGAKGLYQFTQKTWNVTTKKEFGQQRSLDDRTDPCVSSRAMAALTYENGKALQANGFTAGPTELYLMHNSGPAATYKILKANANPATAGASAASTIGGGVISDVNPLVYKGKGGVNKTNASLVSGIQKNIGDKSAYWETTGRTQIAAVQANTRTSLAAATPSSKPTGSAA